MPVRATTTARRTMPAALRWPASCVNTWRATSRSGVGVLARPGRPAGRCYDFLRKRGTAHAADLLFLDHFRLGLFRRAAPRIDRTTAWRRGGFPTGAPAGSLQAHRRHSARPTHTLTATPPGRGG